MKKFACVALVASLLCGSWALADDSVATPKTTSLLSMPDGFLGDLVATFAFGIVSITLVILGFRAFDKCTPGCQFMASIKEGNISAGIVSAAVIIGLCLAVGLIAHAIIGQ